MTRLGKFVMISIISAIILSSVALSYHVITNDNLKSTVWDQVVKTLVIILLTSIFSFIPILFRPLGEKLKWLVEKNVPFSQRECRILIVGLGRSGKTSIIRQFLAASAPRDEEKTRAFSLYRSDILIDLSTTKTGHMCPVAISDYEGQKISQLLIDYPKEFFGPRGDRQINAIIFVVDMFPEMFNEHGERMPDDEYVQVYRSYSAQQLIAERVQEHISSTAKTIIEIVFQLSANKNLFTVCLLINKRDLLKQIIACGLLPSVDERSMEEYAENLYEPLTSELRKACKVNNVNDLSVHLVSAKTGEYIRDVFGGILETYRKRTQS